MIEPGAVRPAMALAVALALVTPSGCEGHPATQTLVHVDAGPMSRALGHRVVVRVYSGGDRAEVRHVQELRLQPDPEVTFPFVVPVVPAGADHRRLFEVQVQLLNERGSSISERTVTTSFIQNTLAEVFVSLDDPCLGVFSCDPGFTCVLGECRESYVPPVPRGDPASVDRTTSALVGECIGDICLETPGPVADDLFAVCLTSPEEAFAVGEGGVIVHLATDALTPVSLRSGDLHDVGCYGGGVVAAGTGVASWNGESFTPLPAPATGRARAVGGSDAGTPLLGMSDGRVLRWDGTTWRRDATFAAAVDDLEQVGELTYAVAGGGLSRIVDGVPTAIHGPAGEPAIVELVAWDGQLLVRTDAGRIYSGTDVGIWTAEELGVDERATALAVSGPDAYAGTEAGSVLRLTRGAEAIPLPPAHDWARAPVLGLAAREGTVLAVGPAGRIARWIGGRNAGGSEHLTFESFRAITHAGNNAPIALGENGTLLERSPEGRWSVRVVMDGGGEIVRAAADVYGTDGLAVVVGAGGLLIERAADSWAVIDVGVDLTRLAGRNTRVAALGRAGVVLERQADGTWSRTRSGSGRTLYHAVAMRADGTPVVGNDLGEVIGRGADGWTPIGSPLPAPVRDLAVSDDGRIWAVSRDAVHLWDGSSWSAVALPGVEIGELYQIGLGPDGEPAVLRGGARLEVRRGTSFVELPVAVLSFSTDPDGQLLLGGHFGRIWRGR